MWRGALGFASLVVACTDVGLSDAACDTTLDCRRTHYCEQGVCVLGSPPEERQRQSAVQGLDAAAASMPPDADASEATQPDAQAAAGREPSAMRDSDASVALPGAGQPSAGAAGTMAMLPDAGAAAAVACTCSSQDACCDGCQPRNESGQCEADDMVCTNDVCRRGSCRHEPSVSACMIDGRCVTHWNKNPTNPCEYCNSDRNPTGWTAQDEGFSCDVDDVFCNGISICGGGRDSGRCLRFVDACEYKFSHLTCARCDESYNGCSEDTQCTAP